MIVSKKISVAVWGLGVHAIKNIIPAINIVNSLDLVGVYSREKNIVKDCCIRWNCKSWNSVKEMLSDSNIDIVYLCTPPGLHYKHGIQILNSNKHLWCEKPFTTDLKSTQDLIDISVNKKLSVFEGFMYLYHPQFIQLKEYIENKILGKIKTVYCKFDLPKLDNPGFRYNKMLGGSCLFDVGCYPLSAILELFPDTKINIVESSVEKPNVDSVDFEGKAYVQLNSEINCILEWAYNRSYRNEIDIWAESGNIYTDKIFSKDSTYKPIIVVKDLFGNKSKRFIKSNNHFEQMFKHFTSSIGNQKKINLERKRILKLANLLDKIKLNSKSNLERGK